MQRSFRLLLLFGAIAVASCASIDKTMESWMGNHQSDLIASWGPPQQVLDDGQGGKIFVYSTTRSYTSPGSATTNMTGSAYGIGNTVYGNATSYTTYNPPQTSSYNAYRMFWIDGNGRIYRWAWKGL
jgi:hypothetical protein